MRQPPDASASTGEKKTGAKSQVSVTARALKVGPGPLDKRLKDQFTYSVIETSERKVTLLDKRASERRRTRLRAGMLSDGRNKVIVDCLIQDRSRTGARLRLALDRPLPRTFLLSDDVSQTRFLAELAWQKGRDAGVKLTSV